MEKAERKRGSGKKKHAPARGVAPSLNHFFVVVVVASIYKDGMGIEGKGALGGLPPVFSGGEEIVGGGGV